MTPDQRSDQRMGAMETQLKAVLDQLKDITAHMATKDDLAVVQADVAKTKEIVVAWQSVKFMGGLLKWIGGVATGIGAGYAIFKGVMLGMIK